jgi:hypothetical protein
VDQRHCSLQVSTLFIGATLDDEENELQSKELSGGQKSTTRCIFDRVKALGEAKIDRRPHVFRSPRFNTARY